MLIYFCTSGILNQPYKVVAELLNEMIKTNKETMKKKEWDAKLDRLDYLSKRVMEFEVQTSEKRENFSVRDYMKGRKKKGVQKDEFLSLIQKKSIINI